MAQYIASYDLERVRLRNCHPLLYKLKSWGATRLLESVWVFESDLSASRIEDELLAACETGDAFVLFELKSGPIPREGYLGEHARHLTHIRR
jgi:hypothetical protein